MFASIVQKACTNTAHQTMVPHTLMTTTVKNQGQAMIIQPHIVFSVYQFFFRIQNPQEDPTPSYYDMILNASFEDLYSLLYGF